LAFDPVVLLDALLLARRMRARSSGPLGGGEAGTIRPRSGCCQGWQRLFARAGARSKSPAPPHGLAGQEARQAPPRGAVFSWLLLFWARKREV